MKKRKKPENGDVYEWRQFEVWADANGIGIHEDDWTIWWDCWKTAWLAYLDRY